MSLSMPRVHRAHRLQQRRALLELRRLGVDALEHQAHLGAVLAAQAAQLEGLLGELAARVADVAADVVLDLLRALLHDLLQHLAALRQQLRAERRLEQRQAALVEAHLVAGDARRQRLPRREREDALHRHAERARGLALLLQRSAPRPARASPSGSSSASILFSTTKRVGAWAPRWSRQIARSDLVTPVSAPRMKTVACALGSRLSVSSGSAPIAFRPGVSSTTSPCFSSGCG